MANKSPKQIVEEVELARAESRPCPYCQLYDGTHLVNCVYLLHKGNVDAKESKAVVETSEVSTDETDESEKIATEELLDKMKPK